MQGFDAVEDAGEAERTTVVGWSPQLWGDQRAEGREPFRVLLHQRDPGRFGPWQRASGRRGVGVPEVAEEEEHGVELLGRSESRRGALIEAGLLDELHLWLFPVVAGDGEHLLSCVVEPQHLDLQDVTRFKSGIVVLTYLPT
ncbi:MAG: hypothetical protein ACR2FE_09890 [Aeromicrobium sp.]